MSVSLRHEGYMLRCTWVVLPCVLGTVLLTVRVARSPCPFAASWLIDTCKEVPRVTDAWIR